MRSVLGLPREERSTLFGRMKTLAKPARRIVTGCVLPLPGGKSTAADVLKKVRGGKFLKGVNVAAAERAYRSRSSSRVQRARAA